MNEFSRAMNEVFAETLEGAADLLESETYKWIRGDYEYDGGVCAVGALCKAAKETWRNSHPIAQQVAQYIKPHIVDRVLDSYRAAGVDATRVSVQGWGGESLTIAFNDRVAKDKSEVIEVFKLAAKDVRNQA